ncbi:hypothetical protein M5689_001163 [Euphorbia peplus]|nr:hypothetical protein M5689_001163 [Euphorbia peplus]
MTNPSVLIVFLLVAIAFSSLDVGLASRRRILQTSPIANVQKTLTEIESLLKQIHALLPKNAGATTPYFNSAALQQTLAQLKSIVERNRALLPKDGTATKSVSTNSRRLFAASPEKSEESTSNAPEGSNSYNMVPISSLPDIAHSPNEYMSGLRPRIHKGHFPSESTESPIGSPNYSPSAFTPSPSPTKKPQGFLMKLFHING